MKVSSSSQTFSVVDSATGKAIPSQLLALDERTLSLPLLYVNYYGLSKDQAKAAEDALRNEATHELVFTASLPAMGYNLYDIEISGGSEPAASLSLVVEAEEEIVNADNDDDDDESAATNTKTISNEFYELTFDLDTNALVSIRNVLSNKSTTLGIQWGWYNSSVGGCTAGLRKGVDEAPCDGQKSGAYMFRPNSSTFFYPGPTPAGNKPSLTFVDGPVVVEARQTYSDWVSHVIRLYKGLDTGFVEVEYTAGPIPVDTPWHAAVAQGMPNNWGKEVRPVVLLSVSLSVCVCVCVCVCVVLC